MTVWTAVVLVVCWAQPMWEQLFGPGKGNLARLLTNASGGELQLGPALGVRLSGNILPATAVAAPLGVLEPRSRGPPASRTRTGPSSTSSTRWSAAGSRSTLLVALVGVLAALGWALRRHRPHDLVGGVLGDGRCCRRRALHASPWSPSGSLFAAHHVRWLWSLAVLVNVVVLWAVAEIWSPCAGGARGTAVSIVPVALAVVLSVAAVPYSAQPQGPVADYAAMPALRRVFRELEPLRAGEPVVYDVSNVRVFEPYSSAVMMRLQELGIEFRVTDEGMVRQLGESRRADGTETHACVPARARRGAGLHRTGVPRGDRQRAGPGRGGRGRRAASTPSPRRSAAAT